MFEIIYLQLRTVNPMKGYLVKFTPRAAGTAYTRFYANVNLLIKWH